MYKFAQLPVFIILLFLLIAAGLQSSVQANTNAFETGKLLAAAPVAGAAFGHDVAAAGNTAVIGAPNEAVNGTNNVGAAYVFTFNGTSWTQTARLTASDGEAGDLFGSAVAIDNGTIVVGARGDDDGGGNVGAAYVFAGSGSSWTEADKLVPGTNTDNSVGYSVAIDESTIAISGPYRNSGTTNSGAVYIFEATGGSWAFVQRLATGSGGAALSDSFGWDVALEGDLLAAGAPLGNEVHLFSRQGANWAKTAVLSSTDAPSGSRFGAAVDIDNGRILVGAPFNSAAGTAAGAAFIFAQGGSGWQQQNKLLPSGAAPLNGAHFGSSVALQGTIVVVGAPDSKGVADREASGAAYLYEFLGTVQIGVDILTAANPASNEHLGTAVVLNSNGVLAGAPGIGAGAVYYYAMNISPSPTATPTTPPGSPTATPTTPPSSPTPTPTTPPDGGDTEICTAEEQSVEEVLPGITLTWDSALRCLDVPAEGQYEFTVALAADANNDTAVIIDDIALTHTTPRPLGISPFADISAITSLPNLLEPGEDNTFTVNGSYELVTTGAGQKANLHFCASGHHAITGELFYLGLNTFLRSSGTDPEDDQQPSASPVISQINITPGPLGAVITWKTDSPATSEVIYSAADNPGLIMTETHGCLAVQQHSVEISNLLPGTEYNFQVQSRTGDGLVTTSGELSFTTTELSEKSYLPMVIR